MTFKVYAPSKELEPFVKGYLEADSRASPNMEVHTLVPNGFSGIFFNFGRLGKLAIKEEYETPPVSIFGQIDRCFNAVHWPGSYSLGVLLEPTVLSKFLRENMNQFTNRAVDGGLFLNQSLQRFSHQLEDIPLTEDKVACIDQYFAQALLNKRNTFTVADAALSVMDRYPALSIHKLAAHLNISQRHLEAKFKESVGLSPKTYALIARFKQMVEKVHKNPVSWNQMDFAHEYYDQTHFIKEFKRFTGHTPSHYLLANFDMAKSYLLK